MIFVLDDTHFADVIVYNGVAGIGPYGPIHILGFSAGVRTESQNIPSAFVVPIPTTQRMADANILALDACPDVFQRLRREMVWHSRIPSHVHAPSPWAQAEVRSDAYSVFFVRNMWDVDRGFERTRLIHRVAEGKYRTHIARILAWNPGETLAVCCFKNSQHRAPVPHLWWYLPRDARHLRVPSWPTTLTTLVHGPGCTARARQTVIVGARPAPLVTSGLPVADSAHLDDPRPILELFGERLLGTHYASDGLQRDLWCKVSDVQAQRFVPSFSTPPFTP